ncbi:MAG: transposase [Anaerolineae bacterium]|nr:transposase [Anaerolineae bacterium]
MAGWDTGQKRAVVMMLQQDYPVTEICEVLDLPRSTFYHQSTAQDDTALRQTLGELSGEYPTYGYRRLTARLQHAGWTVNRDTEDAEILEGKSKRKTLCPTLTTKP